MALISKTITSILAAAIIVSQAFGQAGPQTGVSGPGAGSGGGSGTPGGANTDVQFNSSGSFGGDSGFVYAGSGVARLSASMAIAGCTIGGNAFCVTGSSALGATTVTGSFTATGLVTNADLANPATTVNGQTCTLGSTCTVAAAAGTLTGTTLASNVVTSSITSVGTLVGGATGAGFTVALATSTISGVLPVANHGGSAASHATVIDVAGTATWKVISDCTDTGGNHLNYTQSTDAFSCGTSGGGGGLTVNMSAVAGGNDTRVFFQDGASPTGVLQQNSQLTFAKASGTLTANILNSSNGFTFSTGVGTGPQTFSSGLSSYPNGGNGIVLNNYFGTNPYAFNVSNSGGFEMWANLASSSPVLLMQAAASGGVVFSTLNVGSSVGSAATGEFNIQKVAVGSNPGAGFGKLSVVAGTNSGTCKLIMFAGLSNTPVTIVDNVGSGC